MDRESELKKQREKIVTGLERTYQKLVEFKRYKKSPLVIAKDGEIKEISPEKITPTTLYIKNNKI